MWCGLVALVGLAAGGCRATPRQEALLPAEPRPAQDGAVASAKRKVYLTAGHGELSHPASLGADLKHAELRSSELRRVLGVLSEEVVELGPRELAAGVPGDAAIVIVPGPSTPLQPAEWTALERYLDRGGRLLIALDPTGATSMGSLEGRLGLRMRSGHLVDDEEFLPARGTLSDRRFVVTTQFSAHPSTAALARAAGKGLVLIDAGALDEIPFTSKGQAPRRTITIRSMDTSWLDLDEPQDFTFDAATEQRGRWNLAAAVEGPELAGKDGFRALVFSDAELFADVLVKDPQGRPRPGLVSGPLLADSIRWLGGDGWAMRDPGTTTARPGDAPDDSAPSPPPPKSPQITPPIDVTRPPADAIRTASGVVYKVLVANPAGAVAKRNDTVLINYTGWRQRTGETLYSTRSRGQPMPLDLSSAAPGFVEVLQLLKQGEKAMLWISPALGTRGGMAPPPGADTLVYELEIADIQRAPAVPADLKAPPANARSLRSGTRYVVLHPGTGTAKARSFDRVTYHVRSWDSSGRQIESTEMRQRPRTLHPFRHTAVLEEVLTSMPAGQRIRFWADAGKVLPALNRPDAPTGLLTYELELLQIDKAPAAPPPVPRDVARPPAGAKKTDLGTFYQVLKAGKGGPRPGPTDSVVVHYTGWTTDGRMFDSSIIVGKPAEFPLDTVIAGWTDGLQAMSAGDRVRFWIPEELAYKGAPGMPPGMLVFDVELIESKPPAAPPAPSP